MTWAIVSLIGFVLVTSLVIAMARSSTARWEREKRAPRAPLPPPVAPREPADGPAVSWSGARARAAGVVVRARAAIRVPTGHGRRAADPRPATTAPGRTDGAGTTGPPPVPVPEPAQHAGAGFAARAASHGPRRPRRSVRTRIAGRLAHRHDESHRPQAPSGGPPD